MRAYRGELEARLLILCFVSIVSSFFFAGCQNNAHIATKLPVGWLDCVHASDALKGRAMLSGCAASEDGISQVYVYIDREQVQCTADINGSHPDVQRDWPQIVDADKSGRTI